MCVVVTGSAIDRTPASRPEGNGKPSLLSVWMLTVSAGDAHHNFLPEMFRTRRLTAPLQRVLLWRLNLPVLSSCGLCLLVYLCVTTPPLCSAVWNNPPPCSTVYNRLSFLGAAVSPTESSDFSLCLSSLHSLATPGRSVPITMQQPCVFLFSGRDGLDPETSIFLEK